MESDLRMRLGTCLAHFALQEDEGQGKGNLEGRRENRYRLVSRRTRLLGVRVLILHFLLEHRFPRFSLGLAEVGTVH